MGGKAANRLCHDDDHDRSRLWVESPLFSPQLSNSWATPGMVIEGVGFFFLFQDYSQMNTRLRNMTK